MSGRDERATTLAIAAVIAHESQWSALEFGWHRVLREYGLKQYKSSKVAKWDRARKRIQLQAELTSLLIGHDVRALGICMPIKMPIGSYHQAMTSEFAALTKPDVKHWHNPYTMALMHMVVELRTVAKYTSTSNHPSSDGPQYVAPVFDQCGGETEHFIRHVFPKMNKDRLLNAAKALSVESAWALQVADFVCGEYRRAEEESQETGEWGPTPLMVALKSAGSVLAKAAIDSGL